MSTLPLAFHRISSIGRHVTLCAATLFGQLNYEDFKRYGTTAKKYQTSSSDIIPKKNIEFWESRAIVFLLCKYFFQKSESKTKQRTRLKYDKKKCLCSAREAPKLRAACNSSVIPHSHSQQQMFSTQSRTISSADVHHSAKLAVHTGVFSGTRRARRTDSQRACRMTV